MVVITAAQLRGYILEHPVYVIEKVACLSFDEHKACHRLSMQRTERQEEDHADPMKRPVKLTQSNSFITKIKKTFTKKKEEEILESITQEPALENDKVIIDNLEIPTTTTTLPLSSSVSSSSAVSTLEDEVDEEDEEEALLDARIVRQIVELFSKSMFIFSNTFGKTEEQNI